MQLVSMHSHTCWCNGEACNIFSFVKKQNKSCLVLHQYNSNVHVYRHKYLFLPATFSVKFTTRLGLGFPFETTT